LAALRCGAASSTFSASACPSAAVASILGVTSCHPLILVAETRAGSVTARIGVTGPAASPEFLITSDPDLPQDEVLSRILFQRAAGGLSPGQAIQLAQAVATLSGGSGSGAFEQVRRSLGVDSLDISTNSSGDPTVGASRYISDRVRLGVRAGARPDESAVSLDVDITRRLKAQGQVGADGRSSVGVGRRVGILSSVSS
jgi:translocation and assembly module TamB